MADIQFQKTGLTTLIIAGGRTYPVAEPYEINQETYLTEDFKPKVVKYGDPIRYIDLEFKGLSRDNVDGVKNGLVSWFSNPSIDWAMNNFTLVDENGQSHIVRLWQKKFDIKETSPGNWSIKIRLLKEG